MTNQLTLWDDNSAQDARPLPLIVAGKWNFVLAYVDVDSNPKNYLYGVQDWLRGLSGDNDVRNVWSMFKKTDAGKQLYNSIVQFDYKATNGKTYQMDYVKANGLYLIAQYMRVKQDRPALDEIRRYLADMGAFGDEMRLDPSLAIDAGVAAYKKQGKSDAWIKARLDGKLKRTLFTDALRSCVLGIQPQHYGQATNDVYVGLYDRTAEQLKAALGLKPHTSLRDALPSFANAYTSIAEEVIAQKLGQAQELSWVQAEGIIHTVATLIRVQVDATSALLGVDIATNKPLLSKGHS